MLKQHEKNYSAFLLEMAAAVFGIETFHVYLYDTPFTLLMDHKLQERTTMTTKIKSLAAATVFALMATSTAFAGEIEVGGNALNVGVVSGAANNISTGFLSKAENHALEDVLGLLRDGDFELEPRLLLEVRVVPADGASRGWVHTALNEAARDLRDFLRTAPLPATTVTAVRKAVDAVPAGTPFAVRSSSTKILWKSPLPM